MISYMKNKSILVVNCTARPPVTRFKKLVLQGRPSGFGCDLALLLGRRVLFQNSIAFVGFIVASGRTIRRRVIFVDLRFGVASRLSCLLQKEQKGNRTSIKRTGYSKQCADHFLPPISPPCISLFKLTFGSTG